MVFLQWYFYNGVFWCEGRDLLREGERQKCETISNLRDLKGIAWRDTVLNV